MKNPETELGSDIPSTSMDIERLVVDNDGWIMEEPGTSTEEHMDRSGRGPGSEIDGSSDLEEFYEIDMSDNSDSDGDNAEDEDWVPIGQTGQSINKDLTASGKENETDDKQSSDDPGAIDHGNTELTPDILKRIMKVVYCVDSPNEDTLSLLKEQMEERPKLKIKLLKDLQLGKTMFKEKSRRRRRKKAQDMSTAVPTIVKIPANREKPTTTGQSSSVEGSGPWNPHQPLTLALATAHVAAQKHEKGDYEGYVPRFRPIAPKSPFPGGHPRYYPVVPRPKTFVPKPNTVVNPVLKKDYPKLRPIAPKTSIPGPDPVSIKDDPRLVRMKANNSMTIQVDLSSGYQMNETANVPTHKSASDVYPRGRSQTIKQGNIPQTTSQRKPDVSINDKVESQQPLIPPGNIRLLDQSLPQDRAIFMPEKKTVNIPHLAPCPPNTLDVLVPVDVQGQMKPPFMAIPLDSCNLVFSSKEHKSSQEEESVTRETAIHEAESSAKPLHEPNNNKTSSSDNDTESSTVLDAVNASTSSNQPGTSKSGAELPGAGVFPNAPFPSKAPEQAPFTIAPKILPPPALPPGIVPPGMVPVGLVPGGFPSGAFPREMLPPGVVPMTIPTNILPQQGALHPHALSHPHSMCTCPTLCPRHTFLYLMGCQLTFRGLLYPCNHKITELLKVTSLKPQKALVLMGAENMMKMIH